MPFSKCQRKVQKPLGENYTANPLTIGAKLRNRRLELVLLQKDVAQLLHVAEDTISNWELERYEPQVQHYPKIISFLGYVPFSVETETFGGKIKSYRFQHGLSHRRMGKLIRVDASTVGSWEANEHLPIPKVRKKIEALLK